MHRVAFIPLLRALALALALLAGSSPMAPASAAAPTTAGISAAATCGTKWTAARAPKLGTGGGWLNAVATRSDTDAWAVGVRAVPSTGKDRSLAVRWNGERWSRVSTPNRGQVGDVLYDVDTFGKRRAWAVGSYGAFVPEISEVVRRTHVLEWDGRAWQTVPSPNAGQHRNGSLGGVTALGARTAWAVGHYLDPNPRTLIQRWDGTRWRIVASPNAPYEANYLHAVDASGPGDVWAVGRSTLEDGRSRALALRWDGTRWSMVYIPNAGLAETALHAVAVIAPDDVWVVGWSNRGPLALHWDGRAWTRSRDAESGPADGLDGVAATRSNRVFTAGSAVVGTGSNRRYAPMIQRWNGTQWSVAKQGRLAPTDTTLQGGIAATRTRQWAVGSYHDAGAGLERPYIQQRCGT